MKWNYTSSTCQRVYICDRTPLTLLWGEMRPQSAIILSDHRSATPLASPQWLRTLRLLLPIFVYAAVAFLAVQHPSLFVFWQGHFLPPPPPPQRLLIMVRDRRGGELWSPRLEWMYHVKFYVQFATKLLTHLVGLPTPLYRCLCFFIYFAIAASDWSEGGRFFEKCGIMIC